MFYEGLPVEIARCKKEKTPKIRHFDVNSERIRCVVTPSTSSDEIQEFLKKNWYRVARNKKGKLFVATPYVPQKKNHSTIDAITKSSVGKNASKANGVIGYTSVNTKSVGRTYDTYRAPRNRSRFYDSASEIRPKQRIDLNSAEHYNRRRDYTETPSERAVNADHGVRLQRHNKIHQSPHVSTIHLTNYTGIAINSGQKVIINGRIADREDIDWREQD